MKKFCCRAPAAQTWRRSNSRRISAWIFKSCNVERARFATVFLKLSQAACLRLRSWEKHSLVKMMKGPAMCWTLSRTQTPVLVAGLADKPHLKSFVRTRCGLCIKWRAIITRRGAKPYKDPNLIRSQKGILYSLQLLYPCKNGLPDLSSADRSTSTTMPGHSASAMLQTHMDSRTFGIQQAGNRSIESHAS